MSKAAIKASLIYWRARKARCDRGVKRWAKRPHSKEYLLWVSRHEHATSVIARREKQLAARRPLRLRAWEQMQQLIDEKVTEQGGNNRGAEVEQIIRANGGVPGEPWCGDTVAYCYLNAGAKSVVRAWASVSWLNKLLSKVAKPARGHVVTYTFDHTGLFDRWAPELGAGWFYAGEGNTGNSGAVSDSVTGGDGVKLKRRHVSQVAGFRRVVR